MTERTNNHGIFLNGPPRCGKDTAAEFLEPYTGVAVYKFAAPIKRAVAAMLNMDECELEGFKDVKLFQNDARPRDLLIGLSENVAKPMLGDNWFGIQTGLEIVRQRPTVAVISDAGFTAEVDACATVLRDNGYACHLWRIHRPETDFRNDSREYIYNVPFETYDIFNNRDRVTYAKTVLAMYERTVRGT
jgi:hypothetical protein